jgi:hypothetical protein
VEACVCHVSSAHNIIAESVIYNIGGRAGVAPGLSTGMAVCTLVQYLFNEAEVARVRYVLRTLEFDGAKPFLVTPILHHLSQDPSTARGGDSLPMRATMSPAVADLPAVPKKPLSERIMDRFFSKVSDEEYLAKLKRKRDAHLARIEVLKAQVEAEKLGRDSDKSEPVV